MCRECSNRGCEDRCPDCRPRYGRAELEERRLNRVSRSAFVRCDACGFEGPRFDEEVPTPPLMLLGILLMGACTFGVGGLVMVLMAAGQRRPVCAACGRSDELEPSKAVKLPLPANWTELQAKRRHVRSTNLANVVLTLLSMVVVLLLMLKLLRD